MRPLPLIALGGAALAFAASIGWAIAPERDRATPVVDARAPRAPAPSRGGRPAPIDRFARASDDDDGPTIELPVVQPASDDAVDPAQRAADRERQIDAHERRLIARIADESVDGSWSGPTEDAVREALGHADFTGARLVDVECRTSLCRAELAVADDDVHEHVASSLQSTPPFATNGLIRRAGDPESPTLVVYFARPGHRI
jgi:hypothetical protein